MKIEDLKKLGMAEAKLTKIRADAQKNMLSEFSDDPDVANAIKYVDQFKTDLPSSHPIFKRVEELKKTKDNKGFAKDLVKQEMERREKDKNEREEMDKKSKALKGDFNKMLHDLEEQTDKIFDFLNKNQREIAAGESGFGCVLKAKRFITTVKNGIRFSEMK